MKLTVIAIIIRKAAKILFYRKDWKSEEDMKQYIIQKNQKMLVTVVI